jgi:hypothetical protein
VSAELQHTLTAGRLCIELFEHPAIVAYRPADDSLDEEAAAKDVVKKQGLASLSVTGGNLGQR